MTKTEFGKEIAELAKDLLPWMRMVERLVWVEDEEVRPIIKKLEELAGEEVEEKEIFNIT